MLTIAPSTKIFLFSGATDMRKHFASLAAIVRGTLKEDLFPGHVSVVCNRRRHRVTILLWNDSGSWAGTKHLERDTFLWPEGRKLTYPMISDELSALIPGVDRERISDRTSGRFEHPDQRYLLDLLDLDERAATVGYCSRNVQLVISERSGLVLLPMLIFRIPAEGHSPCRERTDELPHR